MQGAFAFDFLEGESCLNVEGGTILAALGF